MTRLVLSLIALVAPSIALAQSPSSSKELASHLRKDWDLAGLQVDATSSHTLVFMGPRYQAVTKPGLYIDAAAGAGWTVRDNGPALFGQAHGYVGWALAKGVKNKETLFNLYQDSSTSGQTSTTTYSYLETHVVAQRNFIVLGGARTIMGRGPDLANDEVAPGYVAFAGGFAMLTTWREAQEREGVRRMMRGVSGWELVGLYTPQSSESTNFSNFRHVGGQLKIHKTAELGRWATPFHLTLGIEPGLGPMLGMGMMFPVSSPLAGPREAKVGEVL
jgi:hypothetical protein